MGVGQPDIQTTWSTLHAPTNWNMRLSVAGAAKDAQVQNGILLSDFSRNLVVVGRQPNPDPHFASYVSSGRHHRLAVALPHAASGRVRFCVSPFLLLLLWLSIGICALIIAAFPLLCDHCPLLFINK